MENGCSVNLFYRCACILHHHHLLAAVREGKHKPSVIVNHAFRLGAQMTLDALHGRVELNAQIPLSRLHCIK